MPCAPTIPGTVPVAAGAIRVFLWVHPCTAAGVNPLTTVHTAILTAMNFVQCRAENAAILAVVTIVVGHLEHCYKHRSINL